MPIKRYVREDGHRVEEHHYEVVFDDGHKERIIETHVEQVPYALEGKVIEKILPVITERQSEKWVQGKVVETQIERVPDESRHLQPSKSSAKEGLTKEDIMEAVRDALCEGLRNAFKGEQSRSLAATPTVDTLPVVLPAFLSGVNWGTCLDVGLWVALSGEAAFVVFQLFVKGLIGG